MNSYYLMNKNRPLVKFEINENPLGDEIHVLSIETASEADTPAIPLLREAIRNQDIDTWMTTWLEGRTFAKLKPT